MNGVIKRILKEHIDRYYKSGESEELKRRPELYRMIKKMLLCGSLWLGVHMYTCPCGKHTIAIANPCKTRICFRCGWSASLKQREKSLHKVFDTDHFFTTFTIPHNLQQIYISNRATFLQAMNQAITATIKSYTKARGYNIEPGIVGIPHGFGSLLQLHVHFHVLITTGGIDKKTNQWITIKHYPIDYLKKHFRSKFLNKLRSLHRHQKLKFENNKLKNYTEFNKLLNQAYSQQVCWHTHISLKTKKKKPYANDGSTINAMLYAFRYLCRLPISENNIVSYDGKTVVWYRKKNEAERNESEKNSRRSRRQELPVYQFIEKILRQIPDKGERQVFYSGLYGPYQKNRKYKVALAYFEKNKISSLKKSKTPHLMKWAEMRKWHTNDNYHTDPSICHHCKKQIIFIRKLTPKELGQSFCCTHTIKNNRIVPINDSS